MSYATAGLGPAPLGILQRAATPANLQYASQLPRTATPIGSVQVGNQQLPRTVTPVGPVGYVPGQALPRTIMQVQSGAALGQSLVMHPNSPNYMPPQLLPQAAPAPAAAAGASGVHLQKLQQVLDRFEVSIAEANDLVALQEYEVMLIIDDSGSMSLPAAPASQRSLMAPGVASRWDELKTTVALIVDIATCFDESGLDFFFLNRGYLQGIRSSQDPQFLNAFASGPSGTTPLTESLQMVANQYHGEKPVLLFILTDGEPNGGPKVFEKELKKMVTRKSTDRTFRVQIMACTGEDDAVGYLNDIDEKFGKVDVTDDYYSEMQEVLKKVRRVNKFTRGDWCMKAMLGPISSKFDAWDETGDWAQGRKASKRSRKHCDDSDCDSDDHHHSKIECNLCAVM